MKSIELKVKVLDISTEFPIVVLHEDIIKKLEIEHLNRVLLKTSSLDKVCIVDSSVSYIEPDVIGVFKNTADELNLKDSEIVEIQTTSLPKSIDYINKKVKNKTLTKEEIKSIVEDTNNNLLSETELSSFITSVYINSLNLEETINLCDAFVNIGDKINFDEPVILDKHSIGGINGRVSMILSPIISSLGYKIPKTASRSITSAAGTADVMEVLAPVTFNISEIKELIKKVHGIVVWEGKFDLCPVDNTFIKIEHALNINPEGIMIASILSKKKSMGVTHLVIDIPVGRQVKVKDKENGERLAKKFVEIGKSLGIKIKALLTDGENPSGDAFGPALEAKEALEILEGKYFSNLAEKACVLSGELLSLVNDYDSKKGYEIAKEQITSGKALEKFKEIIKAQGGNTFKSEDITLGKYKLEITENKEGGKIIDFNVHTLTEVTRIAGAPYDKGAGLKVIVKLGQVVKTGDTLFEVYSDSEDKLSFVKDYLENHSALSYDDVLIEAVE